MAAAADGCSLQTSSAIVIREMQAMLTPCCAMNLTKHAVGTPGGATRKMAMETDHLDRLNPSVAWSLAFCVAETNKKSHHTVSYNARNCSCPRPRFSPLVSVA
uniref:Uncharacterized protein n=1 Tax=Eutreptiella gymnastica TaxID=73025 RepID=A0A7S1NEX7_9EUGL